ncbi:MAG: endonuclease/exonuclease/phosphatase family protein [Rhabdochlamydiaceae bacterium]|nr:endonuclease/exonuclease/phosphatase family protein [Candidatus Amphrikana amoebophyrae]
MQVLDKAATGFIGNATRSIECLYLNMTTPVERKVSALFTRVITTLFNVVLSVISTAAALVIGVPTFIFSTKNGFYQFSGKGKENGEFGRVIKVASWNINGIPFNQVCDKTAPFYSRVQGIVSLLNGYDVIMLQEAFGDSAYMILKFSNLFSKAFGRSGIQVMGLDSGQLCLTTLKAVNFQYIEFNHGSNTISRGFSVLESDSTVFIQTHLASGATNKEIRKLQMEQIKAFVESQSKRCIVMGDMNIGENREKEILNLGLDSFDLYGSKETCWDEGKQLVGHDLMMVVKGKFLEVEFSEKGDMPINSDHKLLSLQYTSNPRSPL